MTLKYMQIYKEVCVHESITIAAIKLNMAQPAVSFIIKELEKYYGVKLFERMNRRLYITDEGKILLQYADTIINQFEEARNSITNSNYLSTLRIGVNVSVGVFLLPFLLEEFNKQHPNVLVNSNIDNTNNIEIKLVQNELDLAIVDNLSKSTNLKKEFLYEEKVVAICSRKYSEHLAENITLEELSKEKLLLREKGSGSRDIVDTVFQINSLVPDICVESISTSALVQAAIHDLGILMISERVLQQKVYDSTLVRINIMDAEFKRKYFIMYNRNKYLTQSLKNLINITYEIADKLVEVI